MVTDDTAATNHPIKLHMILSRVTDTKKRKTKKKKRRKKVGARMA